MNAGTTITPLRKESPWLRPKAMQLFADVIAIVLSFVAYQLLRPALLGVQVKTYDMVGYAIIGGIITVYWILVFWQGGLYKDYYVHSPFDEFFTVIRYSLFGSGLFFFAIYLGSSESYQESPRAVFALYWFLVSVTTCSGRLLARQLQRYCRERGIIKIPALLVGSPKRVNELFANLKEEKAWGYQVAGVVAFDSGNSSDFHSDLKLLGNVSSLVTVLERLRPREVLITTEHADHNELLKIVSDAADSGCKVKIVPDMYEIVSGQARTHQIYGAPLIDVNPELMQPWEEFAKRALDVVVSFVVLLVGLPVWVLTAAIVKGTSAGPVFYMQERVGKNGRVFRMAKFRSMYTDERRSPSWTQSNDPRVTPFGRFIRKTHLDEIPQLWNVLKGEMSLVGPRPEQPYYVQKFTEMLPYYRRRHKVRPGVTGWWQVKTQSNPESLEEIENRLRYDFFYIENISFKLDLEILVRTVFVMLRGHGKA